MSERRGLGRGLDSLLSRKRPESEEETDGGVSGVPVDRVAKNPFQPRKDFAEEEIRELAASIKRNGLLQPIVVRKVQDGYQLVSGERRLRAMKLAGIAEIPVVVRDVADNEMLTLALVENLQREDLNPIEKAEGFKSLADRFGLTQEAIAEHVGLDRSTVANLLRLLELPDAVKDDVSRGTVSMGHARALLALPDPARQIEVSLLVKDRGLSVRQVERLVTAEKAPVEKRSKTPQALDLETRLRERLGSRVEVKERNGRGRLVLHFANLDDLDRILAVLGIEEG